MLTLLHYWWECKLIQPLRRTVWRLLKKLKIELPYHPAIPLLGIYSEKTTMHKDTCTPTFTVGLFTITRTWTQPECPLIDNKEDVVHIYSGILLSHKRNKIGSFVVMWMDLGSVIQSVVSQKKTNIIY